MTNQEFLEGLGRNIARVKEYKLGMDGRGGQCDCIGLVIGGVRLAGGSWTGTHGSNYAARYATVGLGKISSAAALQKGQLLFKAYEPGESGHALPAAYAGHQDQRDYYHVGVVTGVNPLEITHCTSVAGGIKRDKALGKWQYAGFLVGVQQQEGEAFRVCGGRLRLRKGPGKGYAVIGTLTDGALVSASPTADDQWMHVLWEGQEGYAMARYLERQAASCDRDTLARLEDALRQALQLIEAFQAGKEETL